MTPITTQQHPTAGARSIRRLVVRAVFASGVAVLGWSAVGLKVSATARPAVEAPLLQSGFTGLRVGAQGNAVASLQRALMSVGISVPGGADGEFGPATRQAVMKFQTERSLQATGEVDQATSSALASSGSNQNASGEVVLAQGARGDAVKELQRRLVAGGVYVAGGADGVYGAATARAVAQFQRWNGLSPSGAVDGKTASALGLGASSNVSTQAPPAPPAVAEINPYVGLKQGSNGSRVKELQAALQNAGIVVRGGADGAFGPATTAALKEFQGANSLSQTGVLTEQGAVILNLGTGGGASPPPAAVSPYLGLKVGARGDAVKDVQQALIGAGVTVRGGADGVFGNATKTALTSYQTSTGITADGTVNQNTIDKLGLGSSSGPVPVAGSAPPPAAVSPYLGLKVGARGDAVKDVQQALIGAGVTVRGGADGVFGNATKTALTSYQTSTGITADGTVNQNTIDKLGLGSSSGPVPVAGSAPPPAAASSNAYVGLAIGSRGKEVTELQRALQGTGLVVRGGADGVFGNATKSALQAFQKVNGIPQSGVTTERGVKILALGTSAVGVANPNSGSGVVLERFPVQGRCFYGDTWHAARGGGRLHEGVDIIANEGNLLYAVADGEITKRYWDLPGALAGNGLRLTHANGTYFIYLHLAGFAPGIEIGTKVKAGDVIGFVGNTGSSATPHLHFEVHPGGGSAVNPYWMVKAIDGCSNITPQYQSSFA